MSFISFLAYPNIHYGQGCWQRINYTGNEKNELSMQTL